ncbi:MAG: hypothetical protein ACKO4N_08210 [Verrucomicrobiota bacterium]
MSQLNSLFGNRAEYVYSLVAPVMAMMLADGEIDENEKAVLHARLKYLGVTHQELNELLANPPVLVVPPTNEDRIKTFIEVCLVMLVDGKVDERELALMIELSDKFGFSREEGGHLMLTARNIAARILFPDARGIAVFDARNYLTEQINECFARMRNPNN